MPESANATYFKKMLGDPSGTVDTLVPAEDVSYAPTGGSGSFLEFETTVQGALDAISDGFAGIGSATTMETNIGSVLKFTGKFTITDAAISSTSKVLCWQAPGPYTGKGLRADEAEMQPVQVMAVEPAAGSAVVKWQTPPMISESPLQTYSSSLGAGTAANSGTNQDRQTVARRIGKVRGNVKFSYVVFG